MSSDASAATCRKIRWLCLAAAVATLASNIPGVCRFLAAVDWNMSWLGERGFSGNGPHADDFRELAERYVPSGESLYYCMASREGALAPVDRDVHLALSWERMPVPVRYGSADGYGDASAIVTSRFSCKEFAGYRAVAENGSARLWLRDDVPVRRNVSEAREMWKPVVREVFGTVLPCLVMVAAVPVFWKGRRGARFRAGGCVCAVAFFMLTSVIALTHTLLAPTGLGVHAGKAKLLYAAGGIPAGFFNDAAYSSFQPAYPPGLSLLTFLGYVVCGYCGEWFVQMVAAAAFALALCIGIGEAGDGGWPVQMWVLSMFSGANVLQMATMYYAEGLLLLPLVVGFASLGGNARDLRGWLLLGLAGLVKNEGIVLASAIWLMHVAYDAGRNRISRSENWRTVAGRWMPCLLAAVGPALAWHLFAHSQGAVFYDYAPLWRPGFARFAEALRRILAAAFLRPWKFGFAYPAALLILASMLGRRRSAAWRVEREALVMAGVALACIPAFALVYSYSMAPDFEWHIRTSVDRLLWCPATMLTVFGFRRQCRCNSHVEGAERIMPGTDSATARNAMQRELDVYCD